VIGSTLSAGTGALKRAASRLLELHPAGEIVRRIAGARGRSLVLVYHRIASEPAAHHELVPRVPDDLFRRQLDAIGNAVDLVPLQDLLQKPAPIGGHGSATRVAVTFDDDLRTHIDNALPVLNGLGVHATFFLSGRALHGLGGYWFELLEQLIDSDGIHEVARLLDVEPHEPAALAAALEGDAARQQTLSIASPQNTPDVLQSEDIVALRDAGMTIGFHTLHHPVLTELSDADLESSLVTGRDELGDLLGQPLCLLAYPHGKADARVASGARRAGYAAAWTGRPHAMGPGADPYMLGRWEPGAIGIDDLLVKLAVRLNRPLPKL